MCNFEIDEPCQVWKESTPKARKQHTCSSCGGTIEPGETYLRVNIVFDGSASTSKACASCTKDYEEFRAAHNQWYEPGSLDVMLDECIDYELWDGNKESAAHWQKVKDRLIARRRAARQLTVATKER